MTKPVTTSTCDITPPDVLRWGGVLCAGLIPVAISIPLPFLEKRNLHLTPFDPLVWLVATGLLLWYLLRTDRRQALLRYGIEWGRAVWPGLLLIAVAVASLTQVTVFDKKTLLLAGKNAFQWSEYLLIAPFALLPVLRDPRWRTRAMTALTIGVGLAIVGIVRTPLQKVFAGEIHPHLVGGLLGNRNTYGIFMAVALCLLAAWGATFAADKHTTELKTPWWLIPGAMLPFLAVYPMLTAGPLLALLLGLAVTWLHCHRRTGPFLLLFLIVWLCWMGDDTERHARARELARSVQVFRPFTDPATGIEERRHTMRYYRWAANINMASRHPLLGVGWGQYQRRLPEFYGNIPRPEGTTGVAALWDITANEPLSFSWFFKTLCETGLLGFGALAIFLAALIRRATATGARAACILAPGILGASVALLACGFWTSPMVRGTGPLLGLLLAISAVYETSSGDSPVSTEKESL